jgi:imidazolonepropionase-like amidohydrolase
MPEGDGDFKLIRAARLIDGNGGPPLERGAVLVEGDKIMAVGNEEAVAPPEGARVQEIDYAGKTVLPGLIDCHVHLIGIGDGRSGNELTTLPDEVLTLQAARNARAHLYSGVTTVRDCGAKNRTTLMLREAMVMGITPGPRLVLAGRPIAIIGGHLSYFGIEATGTTECRAAVRQLVKEGVDFIKITATGGSTVTSVRGRPSFTVEEIDAITDEAHKFGKHAAAHATDSQGIRNALDGGVDTIIHGYHNEPDGTLKYDPKIGETMAGNGIFLNPTVHQARERIWQLESKAQSEMLTEAEQATVDKYNDGWEATSEFWARLRADGVTLVAGSDAAWMYYTLGGTCFQDEIAAHVDIGMTPAEAIVSATRDSARSCWIDDEVGTLEEGKQADLLVVDGDPSENISALKNVVDVFQGGTLVDRGSYL